MAVAMQPQSASTDQKDTRLEFLWGTQEQWAPVASIPFVAGQRAAQVRVPKNGFLSMLRYRFVGASNVSVAGSSGTPNILNVINNVLVRYNGGYEYRNLDGESFYVMSLARHWGDDTVQLAPTWKNYDPTSQTNQTFGFMFDDEISLNTQVNADKYLLAAQARNADITIDVTFGATSTIVANTETTVISGTLYIEGLYLLDPPGNYTIFKEPDLSTIQQIEMDTSYTQVVVGDNTVSVLPLNGPKYLQLFFKGQFNGVGDPQGFSSNISRVQLKFNNGLVRYDMSSQNIAVANMQQLGRRIVTAASVNAAFPPGWYMLDFLNDASINNAVSQVGRKVISTQKVASLWLIVTVAAGTTLTSNNMIKLIKRVENPAVGGTNQGVLKSGS